ncbi:E2F6 [Ecytonucleospora hepatopenaei]|uniref:E2F6 n=1 Tax=Ecytonucleospora hepatopenaei TaxID=646526 RepID=A0A1W0E7K4_9MICR|nr:E2F6 [Ecytonucleospora hepatopenaei]
MKEGPTSSKRDEHSLFNLTKKFVKLLWESPDRAINIGTAAKMLSVAKRRLYDITNVLETMNLITKWNINSVKWIGGDAENIFNENKNKEFLENLKDFHALENGGQTENMENKREFSPEEILDREIEELNLRFKNISYNRENLANAYVTYSTLKSLKIFENKAMFVVKGSDETTVDYPKYDKGSYRMKIACENSKIVVFYLDNESHPKL